MTERKSRPTPWQEVAKDPTVMADLIGQFEETHGFSFAQTPFEKLGGLIVTPEMLIQKEPSLGGYLNAIGILRHLVLGNIVIDPFNPNQLGTNSYDVCLGRWFYITRELIKTEGRFMIEPFKTMAVFARTVRHELRPPVYNMQTKTNAAKVYFGPLEAVALKKVLHYPGTYKRIKKSLREMVTREEYSPETEIIVIFPGQTMLAHTQEFIGGKRCIIPSMQARSGAGRGNITVCADAGMGNIGYINRWTMEVRNESSKGYQVLVMGNPYAQIAFSLTEGLPMGVGYAGGYQEGQTLEKIKANWRPEMMLPGPITPP